MAEKRINPLLLGGVGIAIACLSLVMCSERQERYQPVDQLPTYDPTAKRQDGDTQTDTIKALQAYAKEAVTKADAIHTSTENRLTQILQNQQRVETLERENQAVREELTTTQAALDSVEQKLVSLQRDLAELHNPPNPILPESSLTPEGLPAGFGFDEMRPLPADLNQGSWYNPIDKVEADVNEGTQKRFNGLLARSSGSNQTQLNKNAQSPRHKTLNQEKVTIEPVYTLPKDAILTDGLALTALIGRIPVEGQTPDPYPVKIYIGKENLLANGHELPEVEGMIFSGLGFGDWNLSCVSARLMSATFIFEDGAIVNHSTQGQPLGYLSDPSGVPCVSGRFVTNAPGFISKRIGLSALGAAGSAYADGQQQRQTSGLTGSSTSAVVGDINKLAAGEAVQSATDEVSRWLLAR